MTMFRSFVVSLIVLFFSVGSAAETKMLSFEYGNFEGVSVVEYQGRERFIAFGGQFLWDAENTGDLLCFIKSAAYDVSEAGSDHLNHYPLKVKQIGGRLFVLTYASFTAIDIEECFSNGVFTNADGTKKYIKSNPKVSKVLSIKAPSIVKYANVTHTFCDFLDDERYIFLLECTGKLQQFDKKSLKLTAENTPITPENEYIFPVG